MKNSETTIKHTIKEDAPAYLNDFKGAVIDEPDDKVNMSLGFLEEMATIFKHSYDKSMALLEEHSEELGYDEDDLYEELEETVGVYQSIYITTLAYHCGLTEPYGGPRLED